MIRELNAAPTDAEVQKYYTDNPTASEVPEQVHVRHILLLTIDPTSPRTRRCPTTRSRPRRNKLTTFSNAPAPARILQALVKQYSEDPGSKDNGGEYTFARAKDDPSHAMVPEFEAAAFSLTNNQISDVVTTQYGYHIIKLLDKTPAKKLALTDKLPASDITLADYFKDNLTGQKLQEVAPAYIQKLSQSPGVEILDPALKALMSQTNAPAMAPAN